MGNKQKNTLFIVIMAIKLMWMDFLVDTTISVSADFPCVEGHAFFRDYFKDAFSRECVFYNTTLIAGCVSVTAFTYFAFNFFSVPLISLGL